jgi:hypothetical protein
MEGCGGFDGTSEGPGEETAAGEGEKAGALG